MQSVIFFIQQMAVLSLYLYAALWYQERAWIPWFLLITVTRLGACTWTLDWPELSILTPHKCTRARVCVCYQTRVSCSSTNTHTYTLRSVLRTRCLQNSAGPEQEQQNLDLQNLDLQYLDLQNLDLQDLAVFVVLDEMRPCRWRGGFFWFCSASTSAPSFCSRSVKSPGLIQVLVHVLVLRWSRCLMFLTVGFN